MSTIEELELQYQQKADKKRKINLTLALEGVEFEDIDNAYIEENVKIGQGTFIGNGVKITGNTVIGQNCQIIQSTRISDSTIGNDTKIENSVVTSSSIGNNTSVGPFAYIRPGSNIANNVKIGDFVEVKNSNILSDTKISHLTYIGDADLGENINIGCGVVFVNYDGKDKHRSSIGNNSFIGCNVNIISPVTIEENAYIAAGTTVTKNVPEGSLCVSRVKATVLEGWVERRGLLSSRIRKEDKE